MPYGHTSPQVTGPGNILAPDRLRAKAAARAIPCTFIGKHLRFSDDDIAQIMAEGARQPVTRARSTRR